MEYAKDVILDLKNGQANRRTNNIRKEKIKTKERNSILNKVYEAITKHKIMITVITATVSFMVLDILLISSFINVLTKI